MTVVLRSINACAPENESHGVSAKVTKVVVPKSGVSRRGANTFVSNKGSELARKGLEIREVVVHDDDEALMWITCRELSDGWEVGNAVVPFAKMLMRDDA
jgi:hypothetical protein